MWFRVKKQQKQKSFAKDLFAFPPAATLIVNVALCLRLVYLPFNGMRLACFYFYFTLTTRDAYAIPTPQIRLWNLYVGNENYASQSGLSGWSKKTNAVLLSNHPRIWDGWLDGRKETKSKSKRGQSTQSQRDRPKTKLNWAWTHRPHALWPTFWFYFHFHLPNGATWMRNEAGWLTAAATLPESE